MSRFKPKKFAPPRSRKGKADRSLRAIGLDPGSAEVYRRILARSWPPPGMCVPRWAEEAYALGWMPLGRYLSVALERGESPMDRIWEQAYWSTLRVSDAAP